MHEKMTVSTSRAYEPVLVSTLRAQQKEGLMRRRKRESRNRRRAVPSMRQELFRKNVRFKTVVIVVAVVDSDDAVAAFVVSRGGGLLY